MGALLFFAVIHAGVLGVWVLPRPVWETLQRNALGPYDFGAFLRAIPMALICGWVSFGLIIPIEEAIFGKYPEKSLVTILFIVGVSPFLLWFVTLIWGWPPVLLPPGARSEESLADAAWFGRHPLVGLAIIVGLIGGVVALGSLTHRH